MDGYREPTACPYLERQLFTSVYSRFGFASCATLLSEPKCPKTRRRLVQWLARSWWQPGIIIIHPIFNSFHEPSQGGIPLFHDDWYSYAPKLAWKIAKPTVDLAASKRCDQNPMSRGFAYIRVGLRTTYAWPLSEMDMGIMGHHLPIRSAKGAAFVLPVAHPPDQDQRFFSVVLRHGLAARKELLHVLRKQRGQRTEKHKCVWCPLGWLIIH